MAHKDPVVRARYLREYHLRKPEVRRGVNERQQRRTRETIWSAKAKPCADCGVRYPPWVMDLDHRDQGEKHPELRKKRTLWGLPHEELLVELAKCDVVCANCHRERTYRGRQNAWRNGAIPSEPEPEATVQESLPFPLG